MEVLFDQIEDASRHKLYFVALMSALSVPDICASLESKDGRASGTKYAAWFDANMIYTPFTGADCYGFRCSMLHQHSAVPHKSAFDRVFFIEPGTGGPTMHRNDFHIGAATAFNIDVGLFCTDVVGAGRKWLRTVEGTEPFTTNYAKAVRRQIGIPLPFGRMVNIGNIPVIG